MALFKRTKKDSVLPEVDQYYEGERRDRTGLAWLLALVSVIIIAITIIGVFMLGRWAYREIAGNDDDTAQVTQDENSGDEIPSFDGESEEQGENQDDQQNDNQEGQETEDGNNDQAEETDDGQVDAPARTETPSSSTPSVPSTGDDPLPDTGPADTLAIFVAVSVLAGFTHYAVTNKRLSKN